ncbi:hypothetical protein JCGZ_05241 [Jatropha curcas]|uniref:Uncharacterized protein n=1 Tax=Jatropha curcas TaxID=180498 RepID=A0A067KNH5_JATCU|nr:hypothetical protein JCGZ_05241 [Jatropha curcas]
MTIDEDKDEEGGGKKMSKGDEGDEDKDEEGKVKWKSRVGSKNIIESRLNLTLCNDSIQ